MKTLLTILAFCFGITAYANQPVGTFRNLNPLPARSWKQLGSAVLQADVKSLYFFNGAGGTVILGVGVSAQTAGSVMIFPASSSGSLDVELPKGAYLWLMSPDVDVLTPPVPFYINAFGNFQY